MQEEGSKPAQTRSLFLLQDLEDSRVRRQKRCSQGTPRSPALNR